MSITPPSELQCHAGGFVPLSTVDWPGLSAAVLFLRGCPNKCKDCHNRRLLNEGTPIPMKFVLDAIKTSSPYISALIVSGGEPTKHAYDLTYILNYAKKQGLKTRIQTSGIYPDVIEHLIEKQLIDSIALDIKVEIENSKLIIPETHNSSCILSALRICEKARANNNLNDFEVVHTIFPYDGYESRLKSISGSVSKETRFVLQQGISINRLIDPLSREQLYSLAQTNIQQQYKLIRTKECGEEIL